MTDKFIMKIMEPSIARMFVADIRNERPASKIQRGIGILGFMPWAALSPDDSVLLMREASSEEIYALGWGRP